MASKLPIGIQSFEKLRNEGFKYVDKTETVYRLAKEGCYYFLSRPRRFGKSLFLSTLEAYFLGKKELFKGLAVERLEQDWAEYPVLHLDLNTNKYDNPEVLETKLGEALLQWEIKYDCTRPDLPLGMRFENVIRNVCEKTGRQVVILVDEYDKPMLEAIGRPELQEEYRATLKSFYGALKSCDAYIRFAFLTGVTKFGKVSVFSDLNHLMDLSMLPQYYDICGISETELHEYFDEEVGTLAASLQVTKDEAYAALRENYDGYRFTAESSIFNGDAPRIPIQGVYNPFSLLNALKNSLIGSYWFATGTPTYLVELLKKHNYFLPDLENEEITSDVLDCIDPASVDAIPVIYQSGYLTIKDYDPRFGLFTLVFPNREVREGFVKFLVPYYTPIQREQSGFAVMRFVKAFESGNIDAFMTLFQSFLASNPYELAARQERHFQEVMYILTSLCGLYVEVESHSSRGRADMTVKTDRFIYVMEFKFDGSAEAALQQIRDKGYGEKYASDNRQIMLLGINYSTEARNIDSWLAE